MKLQRIVAAFILITSAAPFCAKAQRVEEPTVMNLPSTQQAVDPYFGDYEGTYAPSEAPVTHGGPEPVAAEAKVIAQGSHTYHVTLRAKPIDPQDWPLQLELDGRLEGERIVFSGHAAGHDWDGQVNKNGLKITKHGYGGVFDMKRVMKKSPNEGLKPTANAIVLLAYEPGQRPSLEQWKPSGWITTDDGAAHKTPGQGPNVPRGDLSTKREFRNVRLHLEFRLPYEPSFREQGRGNSGVILADRYEVQVLDSYGILGAAGDCASIYDVAPPRVNAAFPPLSWQTYDITFYAPKMDGAKLVKPARLTVVWNGIKVHENQIAMTPTGDPNRANGGSGPLRLQDHGNLVFYRNIWLEELPDQE